MNDHCFPDLLARRFEEIDFQGVFNEKRRFLCLDLDNTLLPQRGQVVQPIVRQRLDWLRDEGLVEDVCLISNVIVPGPRVKRLHRLAKELEIPHVVPCYFWNRKPKNSPFLKALEMLGAQAEETVMIGDQIFSDILGGNRLGFFTVWVSPMSADHWSTLLVGKRLRELRVMEELQNRDALGPFSLH